MTTTPWHFAYNKKVSLQIGIVNFLSSEKLKLWVVGNSYGRDFVNMIFETYSMERVELVYRDPTQYSQCHLANVTNQDAVISMTKVIVIGFDRVHECTIRAISNLESLGKVVWYANYKNFGHNLNYLKQPMLLQNRIDSYGLRYEKEKLINDEIKRVVPSSNLLDIQALILDLTGNRVRTLNDQGKLLSVDSTHLTKPGTI